MIDVQNLSKRYGGFTAVDDISFHVEPGRIVGFLGPNGAGKTTTMRVLTCFLPPSRGSVRIAGHDVLDDALAVKRAVGYLPETPPLYTDMPVDAYLRFVGEIKGVPAKELSGRVEYAMKRCALLDVRGKLIAKLSKGYRQRVGLAQALLHDPELLILDEPTSGLDPKQILETRDLIRELSGDHTIILSTHILPEVEQICQEVIIINKGRLVATDSVANLRNRLRGVDAISVEFFADGTTLETGAVEVELAKIPGLARVHFKEHRQGRLLFELEALPERQIRAAAASAIVGQGWQLYEMKSIAYSLEEVFLQVTGDAIAEGPDFDTGSPGDDPPGTMTEEEASDTPPSQEAREQ
ncbi:MAG: ATP-binding cassette domain-containing protein [Bryobacterales bacterium]|nr:ATP-binding cassette domain-containing protein [Bryobacterales bacterium]